MDIAIGDDWMLENTKDDLSSSSSFSDDIQNSDNESNNGAFMPMVRSYVIPMVKLHYYHNIIDKTELRMLEVPQQPIPAPCVRPVAAPRPSLVALEKPLRPVPAPRVRAMEGCTPLVNLETKQMKFKRCFDATRDQLHNHNVIDDTELLMELRMLEVPQQPIPAPCMRPVTAPRPSLVALEKPLRPVPAPRVKAMEGCTPLVNLETQQVKFKRCFDATRDQQKGLADDKENKKTIRKFTQSDVYHNFKLYEESKKKFYEYFHENTLKGYHERFPSLTRLA